MHNCCLWVENHCTSMKKFKLFPLTLYGYLSNMEVQEKRPSFPSFFMCLANVKLTIAFSYEGANPLILQLIIKQYLSIFINLKYDFFIEKML